MVFYKGIAGARGYAPRGVIIHNDAGSVNATAAHYRAWLPNHNAYNGFAHYYVCSDGTFQAEDEWNMAWHAANSNGNTNYIGIEACQSFGPADIFLRNEQNSLKLAAQILMRYNLPANRTTVMLHKQFSATSCPHRSVEMHGDWTVLQDYFIAEIKKYMGGTIVAEPQPTIPKKKKGDPMILFRNANAAEVYWLVGNQYTHIKTDGDLTGIKMLMEKAGYDTHIHTNSTQIAYIKKIATEKK